MAVAATRSAVASGVFPRVEEGEKVLRVRLDETRLRPWQRAALTAYDDADRASGFLLTATPGAGKTTFALALAGRLLARRVIDRVVVVCPTDHLRTQWADAAGAVKA